MPEERYVLATGAEGAFRLDMVEAVHGADTHAFLARLNLPKNARIADLGCGTGRVSCLLAHKFVPNGQVVGVDVSPAQVALATEYARSQGVANVSFHAASAYETGLERNAYDAVFSRFMLMHLQRPEAALAEMVALLKPGGVLAIEDGDFTSLFAYPPCPAFDRCVALYRALGVLHEEDFLIGQKLYAMVCRLGLVDAQVTLAQPIFTRGDAKRLPEWTLEEAIPVLVEAGLATQAELKEILAELRTFAADETTVFGMARMMQVSARKSA